MAGELDTLLTFAGFAAFVLAMRRELVRRRVDDLVFDHPSQFGPRRGRRRRLAIAVLSLFPLAGLARAQQTIFNVPSADVLEKGKIYVENDDLWRPQQPAFATFSVKGVYGFGGNVEGGLNFGGFMTPGRSMPIATATVKWQPLKGGGFTLTAGALGLFFLRGSEDGDPAGHFFAHGSYALSADTRFTAGGWFSTPGYASPGTTGGALAGFEQKLGKHLDLIADWYSGKNDIGYFTPGFSSSWGGFTLYAGYSIKNGDSKGNAMLFELGFNF